MIRFAGIVALALTLAGLLGCERSPAPTTAPAATTQAAAVTIANPLQLTDWTVTPPDVAVPADAPRLRILSAAPAVTEICAALRLGDQLVGRTRYCVWPPSVQAVPVIGDLYQMNVEGLLALQPDVILISGASRSIVDRLAPLKLPVTSLPDTALDDLFAGITQVGTLTGRPALADRLNADIRADIERAVRHYAAGPRRKVLLLTAPLPPDAAQVNVAGPGSFYDDLLQRAGHTNVAAVAGRPFTPLSLEFIVHADPDVIIELAPDDFSRPAGDADARRAWAAIGGLTAVRENRVHVLVGPQLFILGPRIALTCEALCRTIAADDSVHPE